MNEPHKTHDALTREVAALTRQVAALEQRLRVAEQGSSGATPVDAEVLREEWLLRDFFENAAIGLHWVDAAGTILWANRAELEMLGYTADEYIGRPIAEFHANTQCIDDILKRLSANETLLNYEAPLRCKDGSIRHVLISSSVLFHEGRFLHTRCFTKDVTERRLAEDALRRREDELRVIVDAIPALIAYVDADRTYRLVNRAYEEWFGQPRQNVVGKHMAEVLGDVAYAAIRPHVEAALAGRASTFETEVSYRAGGARHIRASYVPHIDADGTSQGYISLVMDVTEQVRARQIVQEANEKFEVVLRGIDDGVTLQDATGRIIYANEAAARALGFASVAELLATPTVESMERFVVLDADGSILPLERLPSRRAFQGERVAEELVCFQVAGQPQDHWSILSATPLFDAAGRVQFVVNVFKDTTEARRAEAALRESERRFRAVFDNALDAILIADDDHRIVDANAAACALLDLTRDAIVRRRFADLVTVAERASLQDLWITFQGEGRQRGELNLLRSDGTVRHVEYSATANFLPGRHLSVLRDITPRRQVEATVRFLAEASTTLASSLDYQSTLSSVAKLCVPAIADWAVVDMLEPDHTLKRLAVAHVDPTKVEFALEIQRRWPPKMDALHGVPQVLRTGQPEVFYEISDALLEASIGDKEYLAIIRALGPVSSMCVPLLVRGKPVGAITLTAAESGRRYSDTDLVFARDLARRASTAIEHATLYREAQEANQLKDEFLATVSHELRTPLTAVLGWATMVRARQNDAAYVARGLETIERNARAQAQLIEDLLDLSRMVTGKLRLEVQPVQLLEIIQSALDSIRPAAAARGITLSPALDPGVEQVMGDPARLLQVVNNLLTNAVKFTPKGGTVQFSLRKVESSVEIVVRDNGQGITPGFIAHVFERFRQADATATRQHGGLGLGLSISRSLVEMHGGTIEVESEGEGKGAVFTVRLPIAPVHSASMSPARATGDARPSTALDCPVEIAGLRVLCVDDEPDTREMLVSVLEHCKASAISASSVAEALELMQAQRFDVLLSDIGMPGEDGYVLIERVRALPADQGGRIPAVALTAYASAADRTRVLRAGFHAHITKPVEPNELVVTVAHVMGRFSGTRGGDG